MLHLYKCEGGSVETCPVTTDRDKIHESNYQRPCFKRNSPMAHCTYFFNFSWERG